MGDKKKGIKIPSDVEEFAKTSFKKYKEDYNSDDYYDSKDDLKKSYKIFLLDRLPRTIEFLVKYGHIQRDGIPKIKDGAYNNLSKPSFVKVIKKEVEKEREIENIKLLPIIIKDMLMKAKEINDAALAENPNAAVYDMTDLVELSQLILEKKLEKMKKAGISNSLAFDVLSIIPCKEALTISQYYRIHQLYACMYEHAKSSAVPFGKIMEIVMKREYYPACIAFALLERKEKFAKLTDAQKQLYIDITSWCFNTMQKDCSKKEIQSILQTYINNRKRDEAQSKDGNRRYSLLSLSKDDYERITKVIDNMLSKDDSIRKYL